MFLKEQSTGDLVEVLDLRALFDPFEAELEGRYHCGEEVQDPEKFEKAGLIFVSREVLLRCWTDPHYRDDEVKRGRESH